MTGVTNDGGHLNISEILEMTLYDDSTGFVRPSCTALMD